MKLRHPVLIKSAGLAASWAIRFWIGTLRYRYRSLGPNVWPHQRGLEGRYIYAFWHENILLPAYHYGRPDIRVLISQHADGQLIAEVCRHARAVDVGVHEADAGAARLQGEGQVGRDGGFADAALAAGDGDDVA